MDTACIKTAYSLNRPNGYGLVIVNGVTHNHSRVAYIKAHKLTMEDIKGKVVRHLCNNCACINPDHLVLGTYQDNMDDKMAAGNWRGGQPKKLTKEQVIAIRADKRHTEAELGVIYKVSKATINNVKLFKSCYTERYLDEKGG